MLFKDKFSHCPSCGCSAFEEHNEKSKLCQECGFVYYMNPSAATAAFVFNPQGKLLVCERAKEPAKGTLDLPGGFVDFGETAEEAIVREVQEETGLRLHTVKYRFSLPNNYLYSDLDIPTLDLFFEAGLTEDPLLTAADDVAQCHFVAPEELRPEAFGLTSIRKAVERLLAELYSTKASLPRSR